MNIKEVVEQYNKNLDQQNEEEISNKTVEYALKVEKEFFDFSIDGYTIVPSPLGEICFEWDSKELSFGVSVSNNKAVLEYMAKNNQVDSYYQSFDLDDREDVEELIKLVSDVLYGE